VRLPCLWRAHWTSWELLTFARFWGFPCCAALACPILFPIPTPHGGQSSPNLSAGSSIARQVLGLDSRNNGGWRQRRNWGLLVVVFQCYSLFCDLPPSGFPSDFWGLARCSVRLGGLLFGCSTQYSRPHIPVWLSC